MLVGQDPTIFKKPARVTEVLMLDDDHSQLARWLRQVFGADNYRAITLYATNLVKCSFDKPPSTQGGLRFLRPYFENCKTYLVEELLNYQPDLVLTLGEPAHALVVSMLDNKLDIPTTMQGAFTGRFHRARFRTLEFDYSPCLHIKTFRVAEVYGNSVRRFKEGLSAYLSPGRTTSS